MASPPVSVARILQLRVPIAWQEAVEVAHAADVLSKNRPAGLTLTGCLLTEDGTVVLADERVGTQLSALQLLGRMLQGQAAPPELRALVMSAEDGLDSFPSERDGRPMPKELSIDWFLRPNPAIEIAKLAARAMAAETADAQNNALEKRRVEVLQQRHKVERPPVVARPAPPTYDWRHELLALWRAYRPSRPEALVAAAALVVALGAAAWAWTGLGRARIPEPLPGKPLARWVEVLAAVANAPPGPSALGDARGPRDAVRTSGAVATTTPTRRAADATRAGAAGTPLLVDADDGTIVRTREVQVVFPTEPPAARPVGPPAAAHPGVPNDRAPIVPPAPERRVYSAEDVGVAPPEIIRPQLPSERKADTEPSDSWVEVVVDERGQVAQVRLVSSDASLNDRMLVAAAKAWQFQPAIKDGRPVKYVLRVPVTY